LKVEEYVVASMTTEQLGAYITKPGDQYVAINHARILSKEKRVKTRGDAKRADLIEQVKKKLHEGEKAQDGSTSGKEEETKGKKNWRKGNQNASSTLREIGIGFKKYSFKKEKYMQVRRPRGGGVKCVMANKAWKKLKIIECACGKFFPNGTSKKPEHGLLSDYEIDLIDYEDNFVDEKDTLAELILKAETKSKLNFYLALKSKTTEEEEAVTPAKLMKLGEK
jgi:hypothetical protein